MDNRDSKGRFKKKDEDHDDEHGGMWDKAPTLKVLILLILAIWFFLGWFPNPTDLKTHACSFCPKPPDQTLPTMERGAAAPAEQKTTQAKPYL